MSDNSNAMVKNIYRTLDDKKAEDITVIDIRDISIIADFFVIAHGNSESHIKSLVEYIEENMEKEDYYLKQKEGNSSGKWMLLDYNNVIVHIFGKEERLFYDLERVWKDGKEIDIDQI
ncbi:ribosome-associated protein [Natranaerovirga hydrolytica]|uniref:Ribosomal silencing factor RsfS n=1 Tax=Natranaerovirga hydrolytica TaxID=680378 RepID=A0A4R1MZV0_9FIRM|nr:ribosome silencing factor [Natranaerovirga hydrolytica]TCK98150.1 ribosome-associated protein [Natranaerovirga hydrolytica]